MTKNARWARISWKNVIYLAIGCLFVDLILSQVSSLHSSLSQLRTSRPVYDELVLVSVFAVFVCTALTYCALSIRPLKFGRTLAVETAVNTVNRLLPAGIGAIGGNYLYLKKAGHSDVQAASVVAVNNSLGVIGNLVIVGGLLLSVPAAHFYSSPSDDRLLIVVVVILVIAVVVFMLSRLHSRFNQLFKQFLTQLRIYRQHKLKIPLGLACSMGMTLGSVVALSFSLEAVHGSLPITSIMLVYSFAIGLGAIIPAPGGFGSVDAGLVAALVAYNVHFSQAIACVLVFRLLSFWLPLIAGVPVLAWARHRAYI